MRFCSVEQWNDGTGTRWWLRLQDSGSSNLYRIDTGLAFTGGFSGALSLQFSPNAQYIAFALFDGSITTTFHCYSLGSNLGQNGTIDAGQLIFKSNAVRTVNFSFTSLVDAGWDTSPHEAVPDDMGNLFVVETAVFTSPTKYRTQFVQLTNSGRNVLASAIESAGVSMPIPYSTLDTGAMIWVAANNSTGHSVIEDSKLNILLTGPPGSRPQQFSFCTGRTEDHSVWYDFSSAPGGTLDFFDYNKVSRNTTVYTFSPFPGNFTDPIVCLGGSGGTALNSLKQVFPVNISGINTLSLGSTPIDGISPSAPDSTPSNQFRMIGATDVNSEIAFKGNGSTKILPFLYIPQGQGQTVDELTGSSSISEHEVYCIDLSGDLKGMLANKGGSALGSEAIFAMGFEGMNLTDFVPLATMQVIKAGWTTEGRVVYNMQDFQRFAKEYIWTTGGPFPWAIGDPIPPVPTGPASASNGQPIFDGNPRYLQGNPIDLLLVAMQNELGIGQSASSQIYIPGDDSTLINPNPYIDVPTFLKLRDGQFSGDWMEFVIKAQETGKDWIENQLLMPLGLYISTLSTGQMTLISLTAPASISTVSWDNNSIIGIPALERWDIVNVLQVRLNVDDSETTTAARTYKSEIEYQDSTSISQFAQEMIQQAELTGLRSRRGGMARAFILADRIFRRHANGTPVYTCKVQLRNMQPELGDYVLLTHPKLLDLKTGLIGVTNILCQVIDRQPNFSAGNLEYKLIDTRFIELSKAVEFAPDSLPVWTSSSTVQKNTYLYICNDSGLMGDGSAASELF